MPVILSTGQANLSAGCCLFKGQFGFFGPAAVVMLILTLFDSRCRRCPFINSGWLFAELGCTEQVQWCCLYSRPVLPCQHRSHQLGLRVVSPTGRSRTAKLRGTLARHTACRTLASLDCLRAGRTVAIAVMNTAGHAQAISQSATWTALAKWAFF